MQKQRGIAVITAVFILAILTVIAIVLISQQRVDVYRTRQILETEQSYYYIEGVIAWAKQALILDAQNPTQTPLNNTTWVKTLPPTPIAGGTIQGVLEDYQARININNLIYDNDKKAFAKLFGSLNLGDNSTDIINNINSWLKPGADNTNDQLYFSKNPPYRPAHRPMISISELRLVDGVTPSVYKQLSPYLAALPPGTATNITHAKNLVQLAYGIDNVNNANNSQTTDTTSDNTNTNNNAINPVTSEYFLLSAIVTLHNQDLIVNALLHRDTSGQQPTVTVVWKSVGTM